MVVVKRQRREVLENRRKEGLRMGVRTSFKTNSTLG